MKGKMHYGKASKHPNAGAHPRKVETGGGDMAKVKKAAGGKVDSGKTY